LLLLNLLIGVIKLADLIVIVVERDEVVLFKLRGGALYAVAGGLRALVGNCSGFFTEYPQLRGITLSPMNL
jgi:hypothetical protein